MLYELVCARPYPSLHEQIKKPLFAQIFGRDEATRHHLLKIKHVYLLM